MELQEKSKINIKFYIGNKFKYIKHPTAYVKNTVTILDNYGREYYFTDIDKLVLSIVDFFCSADGSDYKLKFTYKGETILNKWFTEEEIIYSIQNNWLEELK